MNDVQTSIDSTSSIQTEQVAEHIGRKLRGGEVIELTSDLGGGKTTFVRGLARGFGSPDHVSSPTFKISNVYHSPKLTLHHFDFYRLPEPGLIAQELAEVIDDSEAVVVIEWAEIVQDVLPAERLSVRLITTGETSRQLELSWPPKLNYLIPGNS